MQASEDLRVTITEMQQKLWGGVQEREFTSSQRSREGSLEVVGLLSGVFKYGAFHRPRW